jgi:adenylate cyclase
VLEGSVRRGGDRIRIAVQLIDAETGIHLWAERYDRKLEDVFAVQDEVVRTIVARLTAHVRKAETERTRAKPPNSWQAYDYYLQAADALASYNALFNAEDLHESRRLVQRSLARDANYARCYAILSHTYVAAYVRPVDSDYLNSAALDRAYQLARTAEQLDANLPEVHACLGIVLTWKHEHEASIAAFERATTLNPNYVDWRFGIALVYAGDPRRAIDVLESHMRLDPFYPPVAAGILGLAHCMLKQYPQAVQLLRQHVSRSPKLAVAHAWLAATYARLGQLEAARAEAAEVLRLQLNWTITGTARRVIAFKYAKDDKHFFDALRKAGLPE